MLVNSESLTNKYINPNLTNHIIKCSDFDSRLQLKKLSKFFRDNININDSACELKDKKYFEKVLSNKKMDLIELSINKGYLFIGLEFELAKIMDNKIFGLIDSRDKINIYYHTPGKGKVKCKEPNWHNKLNSYCLIMGAIHNKDVHILDKLLFFYVNGPISISHLLYSVRNGTENHFELLIKYWMGYGLEQLIKELIICDKAELFKIVDSRWHIYHSEDLFKNVCSEEAVNILQYILLFIPIDIIIKYFKKSSTKVKNVFKMDSRVNRYIRMGKISIEDSYARV